MWCYVLKLKICISYDPTILLIGTYPTEIHVFLKRGTRVFIEAKIKIAPNSKLFKDLSIAGWIK